jgi:hypothetical protein
MTTTVDLAHTISLSVAPVFLLAGIAGFLNVMSGRLGRIIDRARIVEARCCRPYQAAEQAKAERELRILWRRVSVTQRSIALCTTAGLLVCTVIVGLFVGGFWSLDIGTPVVALFVLALLLLICSLLLFLKEIQLATRTLKMGYEFSVPAESDEP